jgi:hypothetical protein
MPFIIAIVIIVIAGIGFALTKSNQSSDPVVTAPENIIRIEETEIALTEQTVITATEEAVVVEDTASPGIPDGTHTANVTYFTPKRDEYSLSVSLTTENGVVTDATIIYGQGAEVDPNPQRFDGAYREVVIGQKLEDINLSRVGGASLTTAAFNEAVEQILTENT